MKTGLGQHTSAGCRIGALRGRRSACGVWWQASMLTVWTDAAWADGSSVAVEAAGSIVTGLGFALGIGFVALGLLVAGALYRRAERYRFEANDLRLRQAESAALGRLLDVWQWRTDRHHRLLTLNAPTGSVNARSLTLQDADPQPLWTHFTAVDARTGAACSTGHATLRQRIEAQQSAEDVLVRFDGDGHAAQFGLLRALPLHDERGDFMGHVGTVREQPAAAIALTPALETVATASAANAAAPSTADRSPAIPSLTPLAIPAEQDAESFSYTVSHDLRAPIRVVEGFTKIVKEDYGRLLDRVGNDHLDRVLGAAARMNSMIDALLALSQLSAKPVSRQPVNLSQLAGFVVDDLRRQWPQHPVTVHIDPSMQVHGDPTLLRVLLENLLGNAWKYTGKCPTPQVWFERCTDTTTPSFTVRDNGAGFDMRFADRLFGVFQRLHSASEFQGTGIGLASVRRIVTKHGGEVWAESEAGLGASFHFSLGNPPT